MFEGTPASQVVWESHNDEVHLMPDGFSITASSVSCAVQAMENDDATRFGLQFHPEVNDSEYGTDIIKNFVSHCESLTKP